MLATSDEEDVNAWIEARDLKAALRENGEQAPDYVLVDRHDDSYERLGFIDAE